MLLNSYYDPFGVMRSRLVDGPGPAHSIVVETTDKAFDRELQNSKDYLSNFAGKLQAQEVKTKVIVGEHVAEEIQAYVDKGYRPHCFGYPRQDRPQSYICGECCHRAPETK